MQQIVSRETSHTRRRVPSGDRRDSKDIPGWRLLPVLEICFLSIFLMSKCQVRFLEALLSLRNAYFSADFVWWRPSNSFPLSPSVFRFFMPMRESAGRRRTWRRSLRATRQTVSHTKATSSSPRYITSLPTARRAPSLCGTSSSHPRPWSAAAATSSATRTTLTKRRTLSLLAKVKSCPAWCFKLLWWQQKTSYH